MRNCRLKERQTASFGTQFCKWWAGVGLFTRHEQPHDGWFLATWRAYECRPHDGLLKEYCVDKVPIKYYVECRWWIRSCEEGTKATTTDGRSERMDGTNEFRSGRIRLTNFHNQRVPFMGGFCRLVGMWCSTSADSMQRRGHFPPFCWAHYLENRERLRKLFAFWSVAVWAKEIGSHNISVLYSTKKDYSSPPKTPEISNFKTFE